MEIAEFAKKCGVEIVDCGEGWGGRIGFKSKDYPNTRVCGFRTENAAYKRWFEEAFGETAGKIVLQLLKPNASVTKPKPNVKERSLT